ncbi:LysR substrate-binding domain-containing protein [Thauera linaloolentis]|uniref:Putative nitrogen assimilation regulatory protein n=1 Tax=Thauera linaloolentis (strain DSM 12138 / JCM 21573 / CCUG 41526 / CIP 105981 / IAM 15112 / NBRC 102519 / 47Lol) TaxID=1123367 RepID=N6Z732_THAL4|nr:LysR substrate-binding domain-containing protein [Thauera linaloolentis]ENO87979.1 putative nitrogen assimilation regulatory protein [Thauera linaloolentis 47Lol = DSM 12138]MCM8567084.1 LysR substrate-binding domain-containing protein [Thauera linaloolentis]
MDLKQLGYFVRVAELGSFTRASIALDVAQPALSRQVRMLEVELRQNLLVRNGRGVTLTEAGKVLLEHSRGVLHQIEHLREALSRVRGALAGRVAIGMPPSLSKVLAVPVTRAFRSRMPEAALSITEGLSVTMQESLVSGRLDIVLLYNATPSPDIDLIPLLEEPLFLVQRQDAADAGKPVSLQELARQPLVIPSRPNAIRMLVETELGNLGLHPEIGLEIDGIPAILDLVADGAGCAVLSRNAVLTASHPDLLAMRPIAPPGLHSKLSLAFSSRRPGTGTQQAMLELLQELSAQVLDVR